MRRRMLPLFLAIIACTTIVPAISQAQAAPKQAGHPVAAPALAPELVAAKAGSRSARTRSSPSETVSLHRRLHRLPQGRQGWSDHLSARRDGGTLPQHGQRRPDARSGEAAGADLRAGEREAQADRGGVVHAEQVAGGKAPAIFGQTLSGPMDGHQPIMPKELRHYDLHVWLWKTNPKGVFTSTNAAVKCSPSDPYTFAEGTDGHMHRWRDPLAPRARHCGPASSHEAGP